MAEPGPTLLTSLPTILLTGAGLAFFAAGTVGVIRFPDTHTRLHALTKADNLGLGLIALGVAFQAGSWREVALLALIWALALLAAGAVSQLVARDALEQTAPEPAEADAPAAERRR